MASKNVPRRLISVKIPSSLGRMSQGKIHRKGRQTGKPSVFLNVRARWLKSAISIEE